MTVSTTKAEKKYKKIISSVLVAAFWIAAWWTAAAVIGKEVILPTPPAVIRAFAGMCGTAKFWQAALASFARMAAGYLAGIAVGTALAVLSASSPVSRRLFAPIIHIMRAAPVASFIILAFMWFDSSTLSGVMSAVMVVPMMYSSTLAAIDLIDVRLVETGRVFGMSRGEIFWKIRFRSVLPGALTAAAAALGFAWKAGVAAEIISQPRQALGSLLYDAKIYLDMPSVFAVTAVTVLMSIALERVIRLVARRVSNDKGGRENADQH